MTIFPLITNIFTKAFTPLAQAIDHESNSELKVKNRKKWFIGVDDGVGFGESATLITGTILIPIMVLLAFLLPGNRTMPVVDLISLPFMVEAFIAITNGNILKTILNSIVWFSLGLYIATPIASWYTEAVTQYGVTIPTGVVLLTSFNLIARPINGLVFLAFISKNPVFIGLEICIYVIGLLVFRTNREKIWNYLNYMATKNN